MTIATDQRGVDAANIDFWDEVCGTTFARQRGLQGRSRETLAAFDAAYFAYYPYLFDHIPFARLAGKRVLEVGLGYGSVAQRLVEAGAIYTGLDIARGPLAMAAQRFAFCGLAGRLVQGNILDAPFADAAFDHVVAIGCFHHTGDAGRAFAETHRLLAPGGGASVMVYNAYSYRTWIGFPGTTFARWRRERRGLPLRSATSEAERRAYDTDSRDRVAPVTEFVSRRQLAAMTAGFAAMTAQSENANLPGTERARSLVCATLGRAWGRDIYVQLRR